MSVLRVLLTPTRCARDATVKRPYVSQLGRFTVLGHREGPTKGASKFKFVLLGHTCMTYLLVLKVIWTHVVADVQMCTLMHRHGVKNHEEYPPYFHVFNVGRNTLMYTYVRRHAFDSGNVQMCTLMYRSARYGCLSALPARDPFHLTYWSRTNVVRAFDFERYYGRMCLKNRVTGLVGALKSILTISLS